MPYRSVPFPPDSYLPLSRWMAKLRLVVDLKIDSKVRVVQMKKNTTTKLTHPFKVVLLAITVTLLSAHEHCCLKDKQRDSRVI